MAEVGRILIVGGGYPPPPAPVTSLTVTRDPVAVAVRLAITPYPAMPTRSCGACGLMG